MYRLTSLRASRLPVLALTSISPEGWKSMVEMAVVSCSSDLRGWGCSTGTELVSCDFDRETVKEEPPYTLTMPVDELESERGASPAVH